MYSNSYISPNSAEENVDYKETITAQRTSGPRDIRESESETHVTSSSETSSSNNKLTSSVEPIILHRTTGIDDLTSYKNVADVLETNDVEYSGRREGYYIQPSSTIKKDGDSDVVNTFSNSGEVKGAPQGRSIPLSEPQQISPSATMAQNTATQSLQPGQQPRQANPDIQDIITGIVKLLNGNVNVQANTAPAMARPLRPLSTRINNRGPPRITDVPALPPDFDVPAPPLPPPPLSQMTPPVSTTRIPTPYPFDIPPQNTSPIKPYVNGIPLPEQLVPNKRPGFYRPVTIPSWNRPPHRRPGPQRRPNPIPPYKPLPPIKLTDDHVSITSEKPMEDILTLDLGSELQPSGVDQEVSVEKDDATTIVNEDIENTTAVLEDDLADKEFEKNKEKSSSKMDKHTTQALPSSTLTSASLNSTSSLVTISPTKTSTVMLSTTINEALINISSTQMAIEGIGEATPVLESSIQEVLQTLKEELLNPSASSTPTPTDGLQSIVATSSKIIQDSSSISPNGIYKSF